MIPQASEMVDELRAEKMLTVGAGDNVVRLLPPLIIGEEEISEAVARIDRACARLAQTHGPSFPRSAALPRISSKPAIRSRKSGARSRRKNSIFLLSVPARRNCPAQTEKRTHILRVCSKRSAISCLASKLR